MNSIIKRTLTTPVRGDDEQYKKKHDFLNVLLVMYSTNKLTVVDFLSSQNLVLHDITDISNGKENGKPKRSSKFRRIIHSLGKKKLRKMKNLFCRFSTPTVL